MRNTCGITSSGQRFLLAHVLVTWEARRQRKALRLIIEPELTYDLINDGHNLKVNIFVLSHVNIWIMQYHEKALDVCLQSDYEGTTDETNCWESFNLYRGETLRAIKNLCAWIIHNWK